MNKLEAFVGWYIENASYQVSEPDPSIVSHRAWLAGYAQAEADAAEALDQLQNVAASLCLNLPASEIEIAREAWGNTNTAVVYKAINALRRTLGLADLGPDISVK